MKLTPVSVIVEHLSNGASVEAFAGRLTKIYTIKAYGEGDRQWQKQNGELTDDAGGVIPVEFRLALGTDMSHAKGKSITIQSVKGEKSPLVGLTAIDDEYPPGKITRKIKVTGQAIIHVEGQGHAPAQTQSAPATSHAAPAGTAPAQQRPAGAPPSHVDGMRAGMAINNAVKIIEGWDVPNDYFMSDKFGLDLWHIASRIIRVSGALEQGKLDPSTAKAPKEKPAPPKPAPPPPPPPPPEPPAGHNLEDEDEIPF